MPETEAGFNTDIAIKNLLAVQITFKYSNLSIEKLDNNSPESESLKSFRGEISLNNFGVLRAVEFLQLFVPRRLDKHEAIIFSSIYNQERRDLITIIIVSDYMHNEVLRNRKLS